MVDCVLVQGWTIEATAERFQIDAKTVRKWRDRFLAEGTVGLLDRSSRPKHSPNRTPVSRRQRVVRLRRKHRWGAAHIGFELGLAPSTVQSILRAAGLSRLDRGDRATGPAVRYERERPGELVHIDIKKIAAIPDGGGWRMHGYQGRLKRYAGYRYIHTAVDDRTRLAYSEILRNDRGATAAAFVERAVLWFAQLGVTIERVLTDNGGCYLSDAWATACQQHDIRHIRTQPRRPQTNGKVERFHRILLEEWAYVRDWTSEADRVAGYLHFMHFYNRHRSHGSLQWKSPAATLALYNKDNVPITHT